MAKSPAYKGWRKYSNTQTLSVLNKPSSPTITGRVFACWAHQCQDHVKGLCYSVLPDT